jgi:two-component sensor histidine kinase
MLVLIVDDNPDDRALVLHELRAAHPEARAVEVADAAGLDDALADAEPPSLVVTDYALRWTTGLDVLRRVKGIHPDCPVVMFTGSGDETVAVEAMKAGLDDYVVKSPRQLPRLGASIRAALASAARGRALRDTEARLREALAHKDVLLRELHHRVRNNLLTVISLLRLRARRAADPATRRELEETAGRMQALAQVQARVYATEALDRVDLAGVLRDIAVSLHEVYRDGRVTLRLDLDRPLDLPIRRAAPLALLCYELVLNALKHAFAARGGRGELAIALEHPADGGPPAIVIADDGAGFDAAAAEPGGGATLLPSLAREAEAEIETATSPGDGTTVRVRLLR